MRLQIGLLLFLRYLREALVVNSKTGNVYEKLSSEIMPYYIYLAFMTEIVACCPIDTVITSILHTATLECCRKWSLLQEMFPSVERVIEDSTHLMRRYMRTLTPGHPMNGKFPSFRCFYAYWCRIPLWRLFVNQLCLLLLSKCLSPRLKGFAEHANHLCSGLHGSSQPCGPSPLQTGSGSADSHPPTTQVTGGDRQAACLVLQRQVTIVLWLEAIGNCTCCD